jgi:hypothetical protein
MPQRHALGAAPRCCRAGLASRPPASDAHRRGAKRSSDLDSLGASKEAPRASNSRAAQDGVRSAEAGDRGAEAGVVLHASRARRAAGKRFMTRLTGKRHISAHRSRALAALLAASLLLFVPRLDAYQSSLDASAIHDAYILGQRNDQNTGDFLAPYNKQLTEGSTATQHVAEIEILTPFAQVVDESRKNSAGYTEQQAQQSYQQRGNIIEVSVTLMLPSAYPQAANDNGATSSPNPAGSSPANASAASANPTKPNAPATGAANPPTAPASDAQAGTAPTSQASTNMKPENFWQKFQFYCKQNGKNIPSKSLHDKPIYSTATTNKPSVLTGTAIWITFDAKDVASQETVIEVATPDGQTSSATFDLKKLR